ncbi:hypothetical protein MNBD_NITROSPINAE02-772 [hydrothermal vent metagenome]|uniref:Uncharacterized protein n=1 Tax=hydrothermal vent metagenome TaxID=652676 RepID=A0A3B1CNB0_9ZZZZ
MDVIGPGELIAPLSRVMAVRYSGATYPARWALTQPESGVAGALYSVMFSVWGLLHGSAPGGELGVE